jgi:carboxylesterase type B
MTEITNTLVTVTVAGQPVTGRRWIVDAPMPSEVSDDATLYVARNTGKTRNVSVFLGVPYARQPVGEFRWKPAVMQAPTGPIDATHYGFVPPQGYSQETVDAGQGRLDLGVSRGLSAWAEYTTPGHPEGTREDEACLNLNIYTPDTGASLPVIVDFHEGGANYLSNLDDRMSGHRLCTKGAVVVRVGTRLGNLGHYYLPGMELEGDYAGVNFSLTDALAALEWVQDHIAAFGGNPANVTITGGSNGGQMLHCIVTSSLFTGLWHKWAPCSASGGTDPRVAFEPVMGMPSYQQWAGHRHALIEGLAARINDSQNPERKLSDAIDETDLATAMRENLPLEVFLAIDEGRTGVNLNGSVSYTPTVSLTIKRDGETCSHASNRAAALAGAYPSAPCFITVCENEASVLGFSAWSGNAAFFQRQLRNLCFRTSHDWARSPVYDTEWDGSPASPSWGALDFTRPRLPWGAATEPNRMIFNHVYQHAAYCVARAVEDAGGDAYLIWFNDRAAGRTSTGYAGHTDDRPYWYGNPQWGVDGDGSAITTRDIARADFMAQALVNFAASGNPNTPYAYAGDFDLFAAPFTPTWTPFDPASKNWNVIGTRNRSAPVGSLAVTNTPDFWAHAWDYYDALVGA